MFLAGAHHRLRRDEPVWAGVGLVGGVAVMILFTMVNLPVVALAAGGDGLTGSPDSVAALWHLHGAAVAFNGVALGLGLAGFSLAAVGTGLVPVFRVVGPAGAAVIIAASVPVQAGAEGEPATISRPARFPHVDALPARLLGFVLMWGSHVGPVTFRWH